MLEILYWTLAAAGHPSFAQVWFHCILPPILRDGSWSHFTNNKAESQMASAAPQGHTTGWRSKAELCDPKAFTWSVHFPRTTASIYTVHLPFKELSHLSPHLIFTKALDGELTTKTGAEDTEGEEPEFIIYSQAWLLWSPMISASLVNEWMEKKLYNQSAICPGWYWMNNLCCINTAGWSA